MNNNSKTLRTYEKISKEYAEINAVNDAVQLQRELFDSYLKKGTIYDFGCGTGRDVHAFSQMGYEAIGFDGSEAMLSVAKKMYPGHPFRQLDMLEPNWGIEDKPDGIWACASLLHFENDGFIRVFNRLAELLKNGGIMYFSVKVKSILSTEFIDGRFFQYYTREWLDDFIKTFRELDILRYEENENRSDCFSSYFLKKMK